MSIHHEMLNNQITRIEIIKILYAILLNPPLPQI